MRIHAHYYVYYIVIMAMYLIQGGVQYFFVGVFWTIDKKLDFTVVEF